MADFHIAFSLYPLVSQILIVRTGYLKVNTVEISMSALDENNLLSYYWSFGIDGATNVNDFKEIQVAIWIP